MTSNVFTPRCPNPEVHTTSYEFGSDREPPQDGGRHACFTSLHTGCKTLSLLAEGAKRYPSSGAAAPNLSQRGFGRTGAKNSVAHQQLNLY